jgi:hypothetical protein
LVDEALQRDKRENLRKRPSDQQQLHLENLVKVICSCGVSFSVWEKRDADGKGSNSYDFTSMMGTEKKILLGNLPAKLDGILSPATSATVITIWKVLGH